jgi:hypothetical protein
MQLPEPHQLPLKSVNVLSTDSTSASAAASTTSSIATAVYSGGGGGGGSMPTVAGVCTGAARKSGPKRYCSGVETIFSGLLSLCESPSKRNALCAYAASSSGHS